MQVTCSNCGARYIVDPLAIGPTGRTVQCARCNNRWFERAGPATFAPLLREPPTPAEPPAYTATEQAFGQSPSQPPPRYGLPAIARPQPRRSRWPWWLGAAIVIAAVLGAILVFRGDVGDKSSMPWRATGLSFGPCPASPVAAANAQRQNRRMTERVDIAPAIG